jgi:prepilin-type N-terminal cleavage/methylation domain-containing protein
MNKILRGRKGFGLIELLVAMAISSVLLAAISTATVHLVTFTKDNANSMTAIEQVQNVGFWVKRDAVSAQRVMLDDPETPVSEFIALQWTDWDGSLHRVAYILEDAPEGLKGLKRYSYTFDGDDWVLQATTFMAGSIDPAEATSNWDGKVLSVHIVAQVGQETAARTYEVVPRPLS